MRDRRLRVVGGGWVEGRPGTVLVPGTGTYPVFIVHGYLLLDFEVNEKGEIFCLKRSDFDWSLDKYYQGQAQYFPVKIFKYILVPTVLCTGTGIYWTV